MDERPLDPARVYLLKHMTRSTAAEIEPAARLNQIGTVVSRVPARGLRSLTDNRCTGSFILIDPATNFTAGAGMIVPAVRRQRQALPRSRRRRAARAARPRGRADGDAVDAVRRALEEILT